ncbi:MAG: class B sortase [Clostridia bacterium]|nr:class B sortase [Clostridia bacterium]MBQ4157460.1 class B sortase [Clostridia bacterium]
MTKKKSSAGVKRNPLFIPLILLSALVMVLSISYIINYYHFKLETQRSNEELNRLYQQHEKDLAEALSTPAPTGPLPESPDSDTLIIPYPTHPAQILPGFEELKKLNSDLVGRLHIPLKTVTPIELFVVQKDNEYYLTHDFYNNESKAGTLFLDQANEIYPQDQHMIIYGHNMKNGTMFARLTRFHALEYAKNNPILYFDTLYEKGTYAVLAAMQLPANDMLTDGFNLRTFVFGDVSFNAFMYAVSQNALYITNVGANPDDQLLSLVTCSYNEDDERFLLITRRLREGETEDDIIALINGNQS